jgi:hypothetical protein
MGGVWSDAIPYGLIPELNPAISATQVGQSPYQNYVPILKMHRQSDNLMRQEILKE